MGGEAGEGGLNGRQPVESVGKAVLSLFVLICIYVPVPHYMEGIRNRISDISADMTGVIISCNYVAS